jgi:hypothetical protein
MVGPSPVVALPTTPNPYPSPEPEPYTGSATVRWENKTMYCITTVFGLSI